MGVIIGCFAPKTLIASPVNTQSSITDTSVEWPTWSEWARVLSLRDYNTRVVMLGTMVLGMAAGVVGTFMLLRKRALMADSLSHATLPGIGLAFIVATSLGGTGKSLPVLLAGALISSTIGVGCVLLICRYTRIKQDTALGIVLSVFFGLGIAIMGIVQKMETGHAAGLQSFIYGKTASMIASDARMIVWAAAAVAIASVLLFKEFSLLCFDQDFAQSQGWPVVALDMAMMSLVVAVTVIGLQAVGLILIVAMLIIPAAAARFWTDHLVTLVLTSAAIGGASGLFGAGASALVPRLPAGAVIVIVAGIVFAFSMTFGTARGILVRVMAQAQLSKKVAYQNLLRAMFEHYEPTPSVPHSTEDTLPAGDVSIHHLLRQRSWSISRLRRAINHASRRELLTGSTGGTYRLTKAGMMEARRLVRNHRLWELYLMTHADIAPSHVDRDADQIEHVLGPSMVQELENLLAKDSPHLVMPSSPHVLAGQSPAQRQPRGDDSKG